jgi:hypothetical protein
MSLPIAYNPKMTYVSCVRYESDKADDQGDGGPTPPDSNLLTHPLFDFKERFWETVYKD